LTQRVAVRARKLGIFDIGLLVMGSVIGSGIFRTPSVVAQRIPAPLLIVVAWFVGGLIALFGAFVLGELGARCSREGGAYAYLRLAFHPVVAFAYGWTSLLASFSGGLAAAAVLFAGYFLSSTALSASPTVVAIVTLALLVLVNAFGVRAGSNVQHVLTLLKLLALAAVVVAAFAVPANHHLQLSRVAGSPAGVTLAFGLAMIPVLFSYAGALVANFMSDEVHDPPKTLPTGLWVGMAGVALLYVLVNAGCLRALGVDGLARSMVPVSAVLQEATGSIGARLTSIAIAVATLGFLSNRMLTVPRMYRSMADDGLFFRWVGWIDPRTRVPVVAIALQGIAAIVIALSGDFNQILNFVVSLVYLFNGLLALALFVLRARDGAGGPTQAGGFRVPGHPVTTGIYLVASWSIAIVTYVSDPRSGLIGLGIVLSAIPIYAVWSRSGARKLQA
jgi:APA family basic amino acid/polyamine antiporter